jgi:hypothetical protein
MLRVRVRDGKCRARLLAGATALFLDEGIAVPLSAGSAVELLLTSARGKGLGREQLVVRDGRRFAATLASLPLEGFEALKAVLVAAATADAFGYAEWFGGLPHPRAHDVSAAGGWQWSQYALTYGFASRSAMDGRKAAARRIQGAARGKAARRAVAELAASSAARRHAGQASALLQVQALGIGPRRLEAAIVAQALPGSMAAEQARGIVAMPPSDGRAARPRERWRLRGDSGPGLRWCVARRIHRHLGMAFACNKGRRRRE